MRIVDTGASLLLHAFSACTAGAITLSEAGGAVLDPAGRPYGIMSTTCRSWPGGCLIVLHVTDNVWLHVTAAGAIILQEAGGTVLDPAGGPWGIMSRRVLGTNAHLGPVVAKLLAGCKTSPEEPAAPAAAANGTGH